MLQFPITNVIMYLQGEANLSTQKERILKMKNVNLSAEDINKIVDLVVHKLKNEAIAPKKEQKLKYSPAELKHLKDAWVDKMVKEFESTSYQWKLEDYDTQTVVFRLGQSKVQKIGVARCNSSDHFNLDIGCALAYARAQGYEIPDFMFM